MALTTMAPITTGVGAIGTARPTMTARALGSPATMERRPPTDRIITAPITTLRVTTITAATTGRAGLPRGRGPLTIGLNPIIGLRLFRRMGRIGLDGFQIRPTGFAPFSFTPAYLEYFSCCRLLSSWRKELLAVKGRDLIVCLEAAQE